MNVNFQEIMKISYIFRLDTAFCFWKKSPDKFECILWKFLIFWPNPTRITQVSKRFVKMRGFSENSIKLQWKLKCSINQCENFINLYHFSVIWPSNSLWLLHFYKNLLRIKQSRHNLGRDLYSPQPTNQNYPKPGGTTPKPTLKFWNVQQVYKMTKVLEGGRENG